jgi:hypothetical protein
MCEEATGRRNNPKNLTVISRTRLLRVVLRLRRIVRGSAHIVPMSFGRTNYDTLFDMMISGLPGPFASGTMPVITYPIF